MAQVVGFIGLGIMGRPMAKNLLKAGYPLIVHSRSQGPVQELVGGGAKSASTPRDVAGQVDVLITMLPSSPDVELVAVGPGGIVEGARAGLLYLDMSTISPLVSQKVGKALGAKGVLGHLPPIRRPGQPEDIAHAALWLASDESSFVSGHANGALLFRVALGLPPA